MDDDKTAHEILGLVRKISVSMKHRMASGIAEMGLSMPQFMVMHELTRSREVTMHDLNLKCGLPKSTLSRIVDQLVKSGMIKRVRPDSNRRIVLLSATKLYARQKENLHNSVADSLAANIKGAKAVSILESLEELYKIVKY
jgi:DNA-binding MarR family transcriptional regulator